MIITYHHKTARERRADANEARDREFATVIGRRMAQIAAETEAATEAQPQVEAPQQAVNRTTRIVYIPRRK